MDADKRCLGPDDRFVKAPEFYGRLGISKSKFYASVRAGTLPAPIKIPPRNAVWPSDVVANAVLQVRSGLMKF